MRKNLYITFLILAVLVITGAYAGYSDSITSASFQNNVLSNEIVFSIPLGDNGIHYSGQGNSDMLIWGPTALTIAPDGTFWIADAADDHLLHFSSKGVLLDKIAIRDFVIGAGDLEVTSTGIWILGMASIPPKVIQLSLAGKVLRAYDLPKGQYLEDGLSGIAIGSDGSILIEREGGHKITCFISPSGTLEQKALAGYESEGVVYSAYPADLSSSIGTSQGFILAGTKRIDVKVTYDLAGLSILKINSDGSFL